MRSNNDEDLDLNIDSYLEEFYIPASHKDQKQEKGKFQDQMQKAQQKEPPENVAKQEETKSRATDANGTEEKEEEKSHSTAQSN